MDVQQFFKRDHVKMSSLFDKLATTSNSALKTRERLFVALRLEIEAHRTVVEDHLHPLLSKHRETRRLKPTAREINQLDRQLSRVEALDKDDPGFLPKVRELKKTMENRLREERRIVPVLKKALEPEAFQELARELADGKREEQQEARQRKKGGADSGGGRKSGSQENPGAARATGSSVLNRWCAR